MTYNKNKIVEQLYNDNKFNDFLLKVASPGLLEDLKQEVMLVMLEYDDSKLQAIFEAPGARGGMTGARFFAIRIALNLEKSKTSPFYKKFKKDAAEWIDGNADVETLDILDEDGSEPEIVEFYNKFKKTLYWFDAELFDLYIKLGSYRAVAEDTKIPQRTVGTRCKAVKDKIKEEYRKSL